MRQDNVDAQAIIAAVPAIIKAGGAIGKVVKSVFGGKKKADPANAQTQADLITARDALLVRDDTTQDDIAQWNSLIWDSFQALDQAKLHKGGYPNASYFIWQVGAKSAKGTGSMWSYTNDRGQAPTNRLGIVDIHQKAFQDPKNKQDFDYPNFIRVDSTISKGIIGDDSGSSDTGTIKAGLNNTTVLIIVGIVFAGIIFMTYKK
jgi:hypothetical protein